MEPDWGRVRAEPLLAELDPDSLVLDDVKLPATAQVSNTDPRLGLNDTPLVFRLTKILTKGRCLP